MTVLGDGKLRGFHQLLGDVGFCAYVEEGFVKLPKLRFRAVAPIPLEEMAEVLRGAGYVVLAPG